MTTLTRSATLPYATGAPSTLIATARRLLLDPVEIGPIRLLGVGFSGLSDVRQESLFPELEQQEAELGDTGRRCRHRNRSPAAGGSATTCRTRLRTRLGAGSRARRDDRAVRDPRQWAGTARTFGVDDGDIVKANPVDSLDWPDYVSGPARSDPVSPTGR